MDIKKPQLVKVEAFAVIFLMRFCNTLHPTASLGACRAKRAAKASAKRRLLG